MTIKQMSPEELKEWRKDLPPGRERAVVTKKPLVKPRAAEDLTIAGDEATFKTDDDFKPATPRESVDATEAVLLSSFFRNEVQFQQLVRTVRHMHPTLVAHMTDVEVGELAKRVYRDKLIEGIHRVYEAQGRGRELVHKVEGY